MSEKTPIFIFSKISDPELAAAFVEQGFNLEDVYTPLTDKQKMNREKLLEKQKKRKKARPPFRFPAELLPPKIRE